MTEDKQDDFKRLRKLAEDQPVRDKFEEVTEEIPEGPMGKVGGGNLFGAGGYFAVEATKPVWQFVPGIRQPGYAITAHGTKVIGDGIERHVLTVTALSRNVARFAAEYTAAPSNIDYLRSEVKTVKIEELVERGTYSTYRVTTDIITEGVDS